MSIETKKLDVELPDQKTGGCSFALIGSTRSGKTTLLKYLLSKYFDEHIKVLMSNSIHATIYNDLDKDIIKSPIYTPCVIKEGYEINRKTKNHYPFLYILDDVVDKKYDKELMKTLTIYRNTGISAILSVQSPILLNSVSRGNINFVCLGYLNSDESIEKVVRMYLFAKLEGKITDKIQEYKELTKDHHWILIDNISGDYYRFKLRLG